MRQRHRPVSIFVACWMAWTGCISSDALAQVSDGYAIITSRDTILGRQACYPSCLSDDECPVQHRCVEVPNLASLCLNQRANEPPPQGWSPCEAPLSCENGDVCIRKRAPQNVQAFVAHKRRRGFVVHLVDETVWGGGLGDVGADNIRGWLQANYEPLNLRYALLIGDPRPTGDVPMRGTRPAHNAHQWWADDPVVLTDYYYAELTGNWDLDGDGFIAEFPVRFNEIDDNSPASRHMDSLEDDFGPGGVDRDAEISVGRIPFYGDVDDLDHILQKSMRYENAALDEIDWRRSALVAAEGEHRAFFGELIREDILTPDFRSYRIYDVHACWDLEQNIGVDCRSPIVPVPDELHCTPAHVQAGIESFQPGLVTWLTHGSGRGAAAVMMQGNVDNLSDDRPFFTFQASCYNAQPTTTRNLAYELLINGAIGTVGATTISHGPGAPMTSLVNDAGNAGMAYNFALRLLSEGMTAGEALTDLRRDVHVNNRWWYWKNYLTFNLWGDPSLGIDSHAVIEDELPVDAGVPSDDLDMGIAVEDADLPERDATTSRLDAALPDAALPDAALPDAALPDAALPDAVLPDAALPDAALPNAALPDAALPDAALPDAALPDAALPDAALPDAALPDADTMLADAVVRETDQEVLEDDAAIADAVVRETDQEVLESDAAIADAVVRETDQEVLESDAAIVDASPGAVDMMLDADEGDFGDAGVSMPTDVRVMAGEDATDAVTRTVDQGLSNETAGQPQDESTGPTAELSDAATQSTSSETTELMDVGLSGQTGGMVDERDVSRRRNHTFGCDVGLGRSTGSSTPLYLLIGLLLLRRRRNSIHPVAQRPLKPTTKRIPKTP
ncbi:MAG: C25 family cysteine peptidase [Myxococcota bacterium]|nr:C25 family cysteine peptidase [Myxococcota bacterium]